PVAPCGLRERAARVGRPPLPPFAVGKRAPGLPSDPEHLVEEAPSLQGLGYAWIVHHHEPDSRPLVGVPCLTKFCRRWGDVTWKGGPRTAQLTFVGPAWGGPDEVATL